MRFKIIISLLLITTVLFGQSELIKIKKKDKKNKIKETYYVQKSNHNIKNGSYEYKFNKSQKIKGEYKDNLKTGKWIYSLNSNFVIIGNYKDGLKDGNWSYLINQDTISILFFSKGKYEGKQVGLYHDGTLASEFSYISGIRNGLSKSWFENGNLNEVINYEDGKLHGERFINSKDGEIICLINYFHDIPVNYKSYTNKLTETFYSGNLKNGNGNLTTSILNKKTNNKQILMIRNVKDSLLHGQIIKYNSKGDSSFVGSCKNGIMVGEWQFFNYLGKKDTTINYNYSQGFTADSTKRINSNNHYFYINLEKKPEFNGGEIELLKMISKNATYPESCKNNGIQGKVYVQFIINKIGKITDAKIMKGVHPELDKEAIRVINSLPYWSPGIQSGLPVRVSFVVPINFKLS